MRMRQKAPTYLGHHLVFLYRHVLHQDIDGQIDAVRAKQSRYLPTVLTHEEDRPTRHVKLL